MIIIDATGATSGVDFEAFVRGGFVADQPGPGAPSWDNSYAVTGEELFFSYGTEAASKYVLAHGPAITYDGPFGPVTHTVYGEANVLEFGTRGSGAFNADGYFTSGNVELRISGLELGNELGDYGGSLNAFAAAYMGMGGDAAFALYADALDSDAQTFLGSAFGDGFTGGGFGDLLKGKLGADVLDGGDGDDEINGGRGGDELAGGLGDDLINGGRGKDLLEGGDDADTFIFAGLKQSPAKGGRSDVILDFDTAEGDLIDLSGLRKPVDFIGGDAFSGAREVQAFVKDETTIVAVDTNGDAKADMRFKLVGAVDLGEGDFIL